jgi:tRNA(Ile)-lysidine synthase
VDAACVAAQARALGAGFRSVRVEVAAGNVQGQARRARYAALAEVAAQCGAVRIATGHTRTDQAETVLLRLLRGAGARGLSGIPRRRGALIRPLLDRARQEVLAYLARRGLPWRQDPSNATPRYARNRLRLEAWPLLLRENPRLEEALARTADLLREDERALSAEARALLDPAEALVDGPAGSTGGAGTIGAAGVRLAALRAAPRAIQRRVVRRLVARVGGPLLRLEAGHVARALELLRREAPRRVGLRGGLEAVVLEGVFTVRLADGGDASRGGVVEPPRPVRVPGPGRFGLIQGDPEVLVEVAPGVALAWPEALELRTRRPGDRFRPAGGRGGKALKAWLIDRKVARARRDRLALLVDGRGEVLAIPELGVVSRDLPEGLRVRLDRPR